MGLTGRGFIVLAGEVTFVLVALVLRNWLQHRWTGRGGVVLRLWGNNAAERVVGVFLALAAAGLFAAPVAALGGVAFGGPDELAVVIVVMAIAVLAASIALTFWAQVAMGTSWRVGVDYDTPTDLVTTGPFRRVRNPIYTGMLGFVTSIAVLLPSSVTLAVLVVAVVAIEISVRAIEEPFLARQHELAFSEWAATTGRFLPGIGHVSKSA